jgi:hypothetical protein
MYFVIYFQDSYLKDKTFFNKADLLDFVENFESVEDTDEVVYIIEGIRKLEFNKKVIFRFDIMDLEQTNTPKKGG